MAKSELYRSVARMKGRRPPMDCRVCKGLVGPMVWRFWARPGERRHMRKHGAFGHPSTFAVRDYCSQACIECDVPEVQRYNDAAEVEQALADDPRTVLETVFRLDRLHRDA